MQTDGGWRAPRPKGIVSIANGANDGCCVSTIISNFESSQLPERYSQSHSVIG